MTEDREDRQFIAERTVGWATLRQRILEFSPSRAATITGLPAESIIELGKRLAGTRPTGIRVGIGLQRHGGGGMAVRTISCIRGVTGDWRYAGGGVFYHTRGFFGLNWAALWRDDLRSRQTRGLDMKRLGESLLETDNPPEDVGFWARSRFGISLPSERTAVFGVSAGGELALALGLRHSERYGAIFSASPGGGYRPPDAMPSRLPHTYLVAGTRELFFLENAARWAAALRDASAEVVMSERPAGHDDEMWRREFPLMIRWAFGRRGAL